MIKKRKSPARPSDQEICEFLDWALKRKAPLDELARNAGYDPANDFIGRSLPNRDFRDKNISGFNFSGSNLQGSDFRRAIVSDVCFVGADLTGVIGLPDPLFVFFSYAWLDVEEEHLVQIDFFKRLSDRLTYPPREFRTLPRIQLWRDESQLRATVAGEAQIDEACTKAFLGLIMVSHKYVYSKICRLEASYFMGTGGLNREGKSYVLIGVNIDHKDMPEEYTNNIRKVMLGKGGRPLTALWSSSDGVDRAQFVNSIAREIFIAARELASKVGRGRAGGTRSKKSR